MIRSILLGAALWVLSTGYNTAQTATPNILLIIADDMGIDITNGYPVGDTKATTPTLDSLRQQGVTYTNTWSAPQCTPTRASILSGKYGIKTGVMRPPGNLDLEHTSVFTALQELSDTPYTTALFGKWHVSDPVDVDHPAAHGIDHFEGIMGASVDDYYTWEKTTNGTATPIAEYATAHITSAAIDWIGAQDQPWMVSMSHMAPHSPFHVPPDGTYTVANTDENQGKYIAAIESMDYEIRRLLASMDAATLSNTVVLFIGDNGTPNQVLQYYPSGHGKSSLYEGGVRVPLIIAGKGVTRLGAVESGLTHAADLYATILELMGRPLGGGIHNSLSIKPSLQCEGAIERTYNYTDYQDGNVLAWAIRDMQYKLIVDENGNQEFYDLENDGTESVNLMSILTPTQQSIMTAMEAEALAIRSGWSCQDGIQNGDEEGIDACDNTCTESDQLSTENIGCCATPDNPSVYYETIENDKRSIYTNDFPNHNYCFNPNQQPEPSYYLFDIDAVPQIASELTYLTRTNGRPRGYFGVAKNGVILAPTPAQPFIFENPNTGEFNWDWVFEPTNNQGDGMDLVALDCASAHTGPQGYHYHGDMYEYIETILPGTSTTTEAPDTPIHIGWAADGFPILYRFGPDLDGSIRELSPSFQLKSGLRPGDGIVEPCGPYTGKYTVDYEYICGKGDLDECNGIARSITINTDSGEQTFDYYYVISSSFPQIPRCLVGNFSLDFENSAGQLSGVDMDGDGFLADYDCDDEDATINPLAEEIPGNDVDENCDGLLTSTTELNDRGITLGPNPTDGNFYISSSVSRSLTVRIFSTAGTLHLSETYDTNATIADLPAGIYIVHISSGPAHISSHKVVIL